MAFTAESPPAQGSKPQGSYERVLPWQVTMDQLICASLSHTHYWYEVGMLKLYHVDCVHRQNPSVYGAHHFFFKFRHSMHKTAVLAFRQSICSS